MNREPPPPPSQRFLMALAGIAAVGLAIRLYYGLGLADLPHALGDDNWFHLAANNLADGYGFVDPFNSVVQDQVVFGDHGERISTAFHLPGYPAVLALFSTLGITSYDAHQAIGCALGAGTVAVIGLIGRRFGSEAAGLLAAGIAAVYLPLAVNDSVGQAESLYGLLIALTILCTLRLTENPSVRRALTLGALIGLAALTRTEALLLVLLLAPFVVFLAPGGPRRLALVAAAAALVVAPWAVRNTLTFDEPVLLTTGDGSVLGGANQYSTYYGAFVGATDFESLFESPASFRIDRNEAVQSRRWRDQAFDYMAEHPTRVPAIVAYRELRTVSLYPWSPSDRVDFAVNEYRHVTAVEWVSMISFYIVAALAIAGALELRHRRITLTPFVAPIVLVAITVAIAFGDTRFRQAADVALPLLAAAGVMRLARARGIGPRAFADVNPT